MKHMKHENPFTPGTDAAYEWQAINDEVKDFSVERKHPMTMTYAANLYNIRGHNRGIVIVGADSLSEAREQMDQLRYGNELLQLGEICAYPDGLQVDDTGTLDDGTVVLMARE